MAGHFARGISSRVSKCSLIEELGSVNLCWLTMRAADKWESPRFLGMFLAFGFFPFRGRLRTPPTCQLTQTVGLLVIKSKGNNVFSSQNSSPNSV